MDQSDRSGGAFIPEIITSAQYFDASQRNDDPLKRLMLAVLTDAIRCFQVGASAQRAARRRLFREAERWLFAAAADEPFSFETICELLAIAPQSLRTGLRRWQLQHRSGKAPERRLVRRSRAQRCYASPIT